MEMEKALNSTMMGRLIKTGTGGPLCRRLQVINTCDTNLVEG